MPVTDFLYASIQWLREQSVLRDVGPNQITFAQTHTFSTRDWTEANAWRINTSKQIRYIPQLDVYVAAAAGLVGHLTDNKALSYEEKFANGTWETFDDYTKMYFNVSILRRDVSRPEGYYCTCHKNAKQFTCIHSIGVALMRGTLVPPDPAFVQLLGRRRKRGRRPEIPQAWEMLPFALNSPLPHPQQDNAILVGGQPLNLGEELVPE